MTNFVYISTNLISGKQYVGSHNGSKKIYFGSGLLIKKALKKYGIESFKREILEECDDIKEARLLEEKYINKFNTLEPNGYNISPKGGLSLYGCHSKETRIKIGKALRGKKRTEKQKKLMSDKAKNRISPNNSKPFSPLQEFTIIRLHLMMNQSAGRISNFLKVHKGRVERLLKNKNIFCPHPNGSIQNKTMDLMMNKLNTHQLLK